MLTRRSKYGLKALLLLAREYARGPLLASELAEREGIPEKFLQSILLDLRRRGIVTARRGHGGGYQLARDPASINFGEIIRVLEGPLALTPCVSQTAYRRCDECGDEDSCGIRLVMKDVRDETARILEGSSLAGVNQAVAEHRRRKGATAVAALSPRATVSAVGRKAGPAETGTSGGRRPAAKKEK